MHGLVEENKSSNALSWNAGRVLGPVFDTGLSILPLTGSSWIKLAVKIHMNKSLYTNTECV